MELDLLREGERSPLETAFEIGLLQRVDVDAQQGRIASHRSKLETTQVYTKSSTEILLESYQRALSR